MKRVLATALAFLASAALIFGAAMIKPAEGSVKGQYKLGMGTAVTLNSSEEDGAGAAVTTVAVITDGNGKIVDCVVDCSDFKYSFEDAKAQTVKEYPTKNELGDDYGMVAYAGAKYEWYQQAENFANFVIGKDAKDATFLALGADGKAADADLISGCTIAIGDFKKALVKAMGDTLATSFKSDETPVLSLAMTTKDTFSEAGEGYPADKVTDICAVASYEGKVLASVTDVAETNFVYGQDGALATSDYSGTKREKLDSYGMVAYAGAKYEWYEQADNFCEYIEGMTAEEIAAIDMNDSGKAEDADLTAGCTIAVGDLVKIAEKALSAID